jgi:hypothetical protein
MKRKLFVVLFLFTIVFTGCREKPDSEGGYFIQVGSKAAGSDYNKTGVFVSPDDALKPYLIEDGQDSCRSSELDNFLMSFNFDQSWVQEVKNYLNKNLSAFVFYANTSDSYRWIWITPIIIF